MLHDDDDIPDNDTKSELQIHREAKVLRRRLDGEGIATEMVAPRLRFAPQTIDGACTSKDSKCRRYAIDRSKRCLDIAWILGTDQIVLWLAREGSYIRKSKNSRRAMDHAYIPTIGHAPAIPQLPRDPKRVDCLIESAYAILAGLDPADEIDFACTFGKL